MGDIWLISAEILDILDFRFPRGVERGSILLLHLSVPKCIEDCLGPESRHPATTEIHPELREFLKTNYQLLKIRGGGADEFDMRKTCQTRVG